MKKTLKLETDLLKVSKPYEFAKGDLVKNINKDCMHYNSTGEVIYVHDNGDITYRVNNKGATYTPGDQLTKSQNQLIKILIRVRWRTPVFYYCNSGSLQVQVVIGTDRPADGGRPLRPPGAPREHAAGAR